MLLCGVLRIAVTLFSLNHGVATALYLYEYKIESARQTRIQTKIWWSLKLSYHEGKVWCRWSLDVLSCRYIVVEGDSYIAALVCSSQALLAVFITHTHSLETQCSLSSSIKNFDENTA